MLCNPTYRRCLGVRFTETESGAVVARRWGGGFGESRLMGAGFRFSEMKAFCGWMTMTVDNNVNALHAAELYIL